MIGIQQCCCGSPHCTDYWLTGIGKFVQGSGFDKDEAERIAALLNGDDALRAAANKVVSYVEDWDVKEDGNTPGNFGIHIGELKAAAGGRG